MSEPLSPRRPLPKSVYVRRRITVVVIVIAIIVILIAIFWPRGSQHIPSGTNSTPPGANTAQTPSPQLTDAAGNVINGPACDPSTVELTADTDKTSYKKGQSVKITLTLTNDSSTDCVMAVGSDVQSFTISSPSGKTDEVYWKSADCQKSPTPQYQLLKAGTPISTPPITWDRKRSVPGQCTAAEIKARPTVGSGGATFDVVAKLGSLESPKTKFFLF